MTNSDAMPPRYSATPFPAYRYLPGKTPHPTRDAGGHSVGRHEAPLAAFIDSRWQDCDAYLYGVDLFNRRYWWEAHESWERCWVAAGRDSVTGQFLQGLIQVAVACLKFEQGMTEVAGRMATEGLARMPRNKENFLGVEAARLRDLLVAHLHGGDAAPVIRLHLS